MENRVIQLCDETALLKEKINTLEVHNKIFEGLIFGDPKNPSTNLYQENKKLKEENEILKRNLRIINDMYMLLYQGLTRDQIEEILDID